MATEIKKQYSIKIKDTEHILDEKDVEQLWKDIGIALGKIEKEEPPSPKKKEESKKERRRFGIWGRK